MTTIPDWRRRLEHAMQHHAHLPQARFVQLATVRPDGRPANRTLTFRAWLAPDDRLVFTTDLRSAKVGQLQTQPWAELCWYFAETREQFRILGRVDVVAARAEGDLAAVRTRCWAEASDATRQTFTWPPPGALRADERTFHQPPTSEPPAHFGLLLVVPEEVEYLDLRPRPFARIVYQRAGRAWSSAQLNP